MHTRLAGFMALSTLLAAGCARGPAVRTARDLPVKEVVLYRSGVGYFERRGHFEGDELEFRVRASEVGDFLSSLTTIDTRQRASVRSVAFDIPEPPPEPEPDDPEIQPRKPPEPEEEKERRERRREVDITLHLEGEEHDLIVSYVVGTPIWRPSYRFVVGEEQGVLLQAWAIVQNTSGEDWEGVQLSLTTGAPIAFRSDLGTPIEPERPLVTDRGEVVHHVPGAEVAVRQGEPEIAAADHDDALREQEMAEEESAGMGASAAPPVAKRSRRPKPAPRITAQGLERSVRPVAQLATVGQSVTRYDIGHAVTVPDGGSTMVAVLSSRVPGERAFLFAPDPGVPTSFAHPFEVVRIENATNAVLEPGPVSVLTDGAFLGQGLLETLPRGATAFVPFSVDKSLVVERSQFRDEQEGTLVAIQRDRVTVERFAQRTSRYAIRNGGERKARVYVRHPRWTGAELITKPVGTELTPGRALIPQDVQAGQAATLEVVERTPVRREVDFMSSVAANAVKLWLGGPAADAAQGPALTRALEIREQLLAVQSELEAAQQRRRELARSAEETRDNLKAIEKIKSANDLRQRLLERLSTLDEQLAELTKTIVESETRANELAVRLDEALANVRLTASPRTSKPKN